MNDLNRIETVDPIYKELINRFFHPHSYFIICVKYYLDNASLIQKGMEDSTSQLISEFIQFLTQSKSPAQELQEVTRIEGFENIYADIESQLRQASFRSIKPLHLRKAIQIFALYVLKSLVPILSENEKNKHALNSYLEIKAKLKALLDGSNGTHQLKNWDSALISKRDASLDTDNNHDDEIKNAIADSFPTSQAENFTTNSIDEIQNQLKQEIARLLKPLVIYSSESHTQFSFTQKIHESFLQIEGLAASHGFEEVTALARRVVRLIMVIQEKGLTLDPHIIGFVYDAKAAIEKSIFHHRNIENLKDTLANFDQYILYLKNKSSAPQSRIGAPLFSVTPDQQITVALPIGTNETNERTFSGELIEEDSLPSVTNPLSISHENLKGNGEGGGKNDSFELPEEDDSDLFDLIPGSDILRNTPSATITSESTKIEQSAPAVKQSEAQNIPGTGENGDQFYNTIFSREASLYFKLILNAVAQLKSAGNTQICLEDIELASSSMKQLARKFGMEKIAYLPEVIESIGLQANKLNVRVPLSTLETIENGISLLKIFDPKDAAHKVKFTAILSSLKEYYTQTFHPGEALSVA